MLLEPQRERWRRRERETERKRDRETGRGQEVRNEDEGKRTRDVESNNTHEKHGQGGTERKCKEKNRWRTLRGGKRLKETRTLGRKDEKDRLGRERLRFSVGTMGEERRRGG